MTSVSIIIPNYNGANFLQQCLDSCIRQASYVLEIIVVDDHSTDNSWDIIKSYSAQYPHLISGLKNNRKGACSARNFGFKNSSGEFIQFLDSDDILGEGKIKQQFEHLLCSNNHHNKIIHCKWERFFKNKTNNIGPECKGPHMLIRSDLKPADWLIADHMSMTGCWLTPRQLIEKGGLWDETLKKNQDGEFFSRLIALSDEVLYCDKATVYYRSDVTNSVSKNKSKAAAASTLKSIELIEGYIFSLENTERAKLTLANKYKQFAYDNFILYPDLALQAEAKANQLGGASVKLSGGAGLEVLSSIVGWKNTLLIKKRIQRLLK